MRRGHRHPRHHARHHRRAHSEEDEPRRRDQDAQGQCGDQAVVPQHPLQRQASLLQFTSAVEAYFAGHSIRSDSWVTRIVRVVTTLPSFQKKPPLG